MANTYNLIASTVLGSSNQNVAFTSIPQTYNDLLLKITSRATDAGTVGRYSLYFNAVDSGTSYHYSGLVVGGNASYEQGVSTYSFREQLIPYATADANTFDANEYYIPNYTNTSLFKSAFNYQGVTADNSSQYIFYASNMKANTAAITSLHLNAGGTFAANSSFFLYGIKNS